MDSHTILVVDDDEQVRELVQLSLELAGHKVSGADDGIKAGRALQDGAFDLVITDLLMPECDGLELIDRLRRKHPMIRIIAMSGGGRVAREDYLKIAKKFGAHLVLGKPFDQIQLLDAVEKVLLSA